MAVYCRSFSFLLALLFLPISVLFAVEPQPREVKNVIFMIADGTSHSALSLARWYQRYLWRDSLYLALDPHICGSVITYCSNAPIGDSAPTTSCYMTGVPSITGFISTHPFSSGEHDLVPLDSAQAYKPLITVMEAARLEKGRRLGIVVTCQYPHATPADCAAHHPKRSEYSVLAKQMAHNSIDVLIGGGTRYLADAERDYLQEAGYEVLTDDLEALRNSSSERVWALFEPKAFPMDIDRDSAKIPSLAEATRIAIEKLSRGDEGFFLMVEGSQVDWAAHDNDAVGVVTETLAFDRACREALDFARRDGKTAVVITADHATGGISLGSDAWPNYDKYTAEELFSKLVRIRRTAAGVASELRDTPPEFVDSLFSAAAGFPLTEQEHAQLHTLKEYRRSPLAVAARKSQEGSLYGKSMAEFVADVYTARLPIGFTTHGHTGEQVFLAVYNPHGERITGVVQNSDLHRYLSSLIGFPQGIDALNAKYFSPHDEVFRGQKVELLRDDKGTASLLVRHKGRELRVEPNSSVVLVDGKPRALSSVVVYSAKRERFYLPAELAGWWSGKGN